MEIKDRLNHTLEVVKYWKKNDEIILSIREASIYEWGQTFVFYLSIDDADKLIQELQELKQS